MKLTIVGSGDAFGSGGRLNTCFLVETRGRTVLLDCGASSVPGLKAQGVDPNDIDGVVLTHLHGDHFGGVVFLLMDAHFANARERPFSIVGPPGTRTRVDAALEVFFPGSTANKWRFAWDVVEIEPGRTTEFLGLSILSAEVIHRSGAPSTAIRLTDGERVLAYSGDTEWTDALLEIGAGADLLILECYEHTRSVPGHMSWAKLRTHLADFHARRLMITHMNASMLANTGEPRAAGVLIASDGLVVEI
jgi:ribonuclease BN (tRNA processing enzyme)